MTCLALYTSSPPQLRGSERVGDLSRVTEQKPKSAKPKPTRFQGLRAYVLHKQGLLMLEDKDLRCRGGTSAGRGRNQLRAGGTKAGC